jgi:hypothetical protein
MSHAFVLRHVEQLDVGSLHIVRDCRGVAFSWAKHVARPETVRGTSYMPRFGPAAVAARWLFDNAGAHLLSALEDRGVFLRYETFVDAPRDELGRALTLLGEPTASGQLDRLMEDAVALKPTHSVSGNPMRFRTDTVPIKLDDQWRRDMPRRDRLIVTFLAWPLLRAYGYTGESHGEANDSASTGET